MVYGWYIELVIGIFSPNLQLGGHHLVAIWIYQNDDDTWVYRPAHYHDTVDACEVLHQVMDQSHPCLGWLVRPHFYDTKSNKNIQGAW